MVVQGANDPRVNKRESDQIVIALRDRNYPIQYLLADDEGHGFARPVNNMAMFAAGEKFLAKYLGGRFQETMTPEVGKRLGEITVDPKTVTLAKPVSMTAAPGANVSGKWTLSVDTGREIIEVVLELKQTDAGMTGTMSSATGGGTVEKSTVNGNNLSITLKGEVQGQPTELQVDGKIDGPAISGTISVPGLGSFPFTGSRPK
jgi:hypothetical protein